MTWVAAVGRWATAVLSAGAPLGAHPTSSITYSTPIHTAKRMMDILTVMIDNNYNTFPGHDKPPAMGVLDAKA